MTKWVLLSVSVVLSIMCLGCGGKIPNGNLAPDLDDREVSTIVDSLNGEEFDHSTSGYFFFSRVLDILSDDHAYYSPGAFPIGSNSALACYHFDMDSDDDVNTVTLDWVTAPTSALSVYVWDYDGSTGWVNVPPNSSPTTFYLDGMEAYRDDLGFGDYRLTVRVLVGPAGSVAELSQITISEE
jgi:hypothetical protein